MSGVERLPAAAFGLPRTVPGSNELQTWQTSEVSNGKSGTFPVRALALRARQVERGYARMKQAVRQQSTEDDTIKAHQAANLP